MISVFSGAFRGVCVAEKQKCFLINFLKIICCSCCCLGYILFSLTGLLYFFSVTTEV